MSDEITNCRSAAPKIAISPDFLAYPSKKTLVMMFIVSLVVVTLGVALSGYERNVNTTFVLLRTLFIYAVTPLGGLLAIYCIHKIISPSPSVLISKKGIAFFSVGSVELQWDEIDDFRIEKCQNHRVIVIYPKNSNAVLSRMSIWGRLGVRLTASGMGRAPAFYITEGLVAMPLEKFMVEMVSRMPQRIESK